MYFDVVEEIDCIIDKHVSSHVNIHSFIEFSNRFVVEGEFQGVDRNNNL